MKNNTDLPSLSMVEKTVGYKGKMASSAISAAVNLLPVTTGTTYDAAQADVARSKISDTDQASAVFRSFVNYGTAQAENYKEDTSTVATANCAIHFAVTISGADNPSSNKYTLSVGYKNDNAVVVNQWVLASRGKDGNNYEIQTMADAKTEAVTIDNDISQTTLDQTYEFLLWADGTNISSAIAAIQGMVVFTLTLNA